MAKPSNSNRWFLSAAVALMAVALIAAPLDFTPSDWQLSKSAAEAKGGGGNGNGGKGGGNGKGHDKGNDTSSIKSGGKDSGKSANAKGNKGGSKNKTQKRYAKALGLGVDGAGVKPGKSIHTFSHKEVMGLLGHKWKTAHFDDLNFYNHGQRVSTMVKLAKLLGYGAWVGAMQANFGTMQELGIADLQDAVTDAQSDLDAVVEALAAGDPTVTQADLLAATQALEDAQADLLAVDQIAADAKPGLGPKGEWATVDLDYNDDDVVDTKDIDDFLNPPEP